MNVLIVNIKIPPVKMPTYKLSLSTPNACGGLSGGVSNKKGWVQKSTFTFFRHFEILLFEVDILEVNILEVDIATHTTKTLQNVDVFCLLPVLCMNSLNALGD
jgi:hypothetical protein